MQYRQLGGTGIDVSRIVLGCGNIGGIGSAPEFFGMGEGEAEALRIMDAAWEMGITTFDTADAYGGGRSETAIGRWIATRDAAVRDRIVVATKVFHSVAGDPRDRGLDPARIRRQIEGSLTRLGMERVPLYLIHEPDPSTPVADTLGALDALVRAGTVQAVGASNIGPKALSEALAVSRHRDLARFEWVQNSYSLLDREPEKGLLGLCEREGLGFTPFSPLAGGWLTGKYRRGQPYPNGSRMTLRPDTYRALENDRVFDGLERLRELADERGATMQTLAIAWLLSHPTVTAVVVGPRRPEHLEPARAALDLVLSAEERDQIGSVVRS